MKQAGKHEKKQFRSREESIQKSSKKVGLKQWNQSIFQIINKRSQKSSENPGSKFAGRKQGTHEESIKKVRLVLHRNVWKRLASKLGWKYTRKQQGTREEGVRKGIQCLGKRVCKESSK